MAQRGAAATGGNRPRGRRGRVLKLVIGISLGAALVYLAVRLFELDRINRDTPDQDDPLFDDDRERP